MPKPIIPLLLFISAVLPLSAADTEITETLRLPECHSIGWVRANAGVKEQGAGNIILDEAKWGTPAANQVIEQHWDWKLSDEQWAEAVKQKGEGKKEEVKFDLWIPEGVASASGIVVISGHGSGETLFKHPELRKIARELHLALFKFVGNPMQRGFWPRSLLYDRLKDFGDKSQHPELANAPLFLYGHSNGTGFSAIFPATEGERVWAWVSMRPGTTYQVYQPGAAQVPGMIIFGEDDAFFARPSKEQNMAVVEAMRKKHHALWHYAVEPKTGHGPGEKTWPLVFSFLRHSFAARVPAEVDAAKGPVKLNELQAEGGQLGQNWNAATGGYQTLPIAPFAEFTGDKSTASWLLNASFATDWRTFQRDGQLDSPNRMNAIDHIVPVIFHRSLIGIWGPILLLAIPPAIKTKSWKSFFRSLLWVSLGIVVPVGWFLLSTGLLAEWKGGCRFGAWDCFVVGKLWLSPLVIWALAALYARVIWKTENPTQKWIVLGYWTGAVVSTICLIHGLIVYTEGLLQIWPFSVPIAVSAYYIIVSRRLLAANQISWSELIGTLLGGVPLWAASVWQSLRTYSNLPDQAPECFVVTAASRGHPWLVGPHQMIQRYQVEREVNKQLVTF